jgi:hypothetical protein
MARTACAAAKAGERPLPASSVTTSGYSPPPRLAPWRQQQFARRTRSIRDTLAGFPNLVPPNHGASACMASQGGKMGSAPTLSKPNLDRLRTGHRAELTWRFIPGHDVCPLTDRAYALCILSRSQVSFVKFPRLE